jgi:enoyl-CoA hydratase/carnithine racemase
MSMAQAAQATATEESSPRPPEGDWLGSPYLRFERDAPFARVVVDRPEARNALTPAMYFGFRYAVQRVERDPDLAGLLVTGTGDTFIPGGDLGQGGVDDWMDFQHLMMDVTPFDTLRQAATPMVCAVNGICQGGGLMIALCSDMAVVSERATFRVPELYRGIADTYYSHMLLAAVGPARTRDLMFTGRTLDAAEALDWGLISRVVPHDDVVPAAREVLAQVCRTAPGARNDVKRSIDATVGLYDRIAMRTNLQGDEAREGYRAFAERRNPSWVHPDLRTDGRL